MERLLEEKLKTIEGSVYFYDYRKNCRCPALEDLWNQIKETDKAQKEAQEYAEEYIKDPGRYKKDKIFMNALARRTDRFNSQIIKYQDIFADKCKQRDIIFEIGDREVDFTKISRKKNYTIRCNQCRTEIPFLKYPGWNE